MKKLQTEKNTEGVFVRITKEEKAYLKKNKISITKLVKWAIEEIKKQ